MPTPQIKDAKLEIPCGCSSGSSPPVASRGGRIGPYENWTKKDLLQRAREIGIKGRSSMSKSQLITALRGH